MLRLGLRRFSEDPSELEAWGLELGSSFIFLLVFWIRDIGYLPVPACSTAAALVALILGRAGLRD